MTYINLVHDLLMKEQPVGNSESTKNSEISSFQDITVSIEYGNVYKITLNRPAKYNAITVKVSLAN